MLNRLLPGPHDRDVQIAAQVVAEAILAGIFCGGSDPRDGFFVDSWLSTLTSRHTALCNVHNIRRATNSVTAPFVLSTRQIEATAGSDEELTPTTSGNGFIAVVTMRAKALPLWIIDDAGSFQY